MQLIVASQYYKIYYDSNFLIGEIQWTSGTYMLDLNKLKPVIIEAYSHFFNMKILGLVHNLEETVFPLTKDFKEWIVTKYKRDIADKLKPKRVAMVLPEEAFTRYFVKIFFEATAEYWDYSVRRTFIKRQDALNWIYDEIRNLQAHPKTSSTGQVSTF